MSRNALVIGGTGPTGPTVVNGLRDRGYQVTILHGGLHESDELPPDVPHIHADPHFAETLAPAVADGRFQLVVAQYGRLRVIADVFRRRTDQMVAIGASTGMAAAETSPEWGALGRPALLTENRIVRETDAVANKLGARMAEAQDALFRSADEGGYSATYLGYPVLYGPNQPGPQDWSIIRRALDGRRRMIIADGGLKLETRGFTQNVARAVLLAVDQPATAAGKSYIVCDPHTWTMRQRIEFVAGVLGHEFEFVDLPWEQARPCHPLWRYQRTHRLSDSALIRTELGYREEVPVEAALERSVRWLVEHPMPRGSEMEQQLGDPFDYEAEDRLMEQAARSAAGFDAIEYALPGYSHQYRHPATPGEAWRAGTVTRG